MDYGLLIWVGFKRNYVFAFPLSTPRIEQSKMWGFGAVEWVNRSSYLSQSLWMGGM